MLLSTLIPTDSATLSAPSQEIPTEAIPTEADLSSFLSDSNPPLPTNDNDISLNQSSTQIDLTLSTHPAPSQPRMTIIFPAHGKKGDSILATMVVEVHPNGALRLSESSEVDGLDTTPARHDEEMRDVDNEQEITDRRMKTLERALEISEDVGIWAEFILQNSVK